MQSELKPCAHCGGEAYIDDDTMGHSVVCCKNIECRAQGPFRPTDDEAITAWNTRASDAEIARLTEALRSAEERASLTIPSDIAKAVASIGQVEWGATDEKYAAGHAASVQKSVEMTAVYFNQTGPQPMHGVYIKGDDVVVCHTGTSPNSGQHARAIVGAWNFMLQHARPALKERPHADT